MKLKIFFSIFIIVVAAAGLFFLLKSSPKPSSQGGEPNTVQDFVNQTFAENREVASGTTPSLNPSPQGGGEKQVDFSLQSGGDEAVSVQSICTGDKQSDFDCYQSYYVAVVKGVGIAAALADLRERYNGNDYVQSQCHPLTHVIGNEAAKKFADVAEAYKQGDSFCWSGYYHGVLEGIIGRIGLSKLESQMNEICASLAATERYSFDHYNCVHGLGHGVMAIYDDELFKSLEVCDKVTDSWERSSCWSGAFMENVIFDTKYHYAKYLKPEDPLYPCDAVAEQYKSTCYLMQTSYMLKVTNGDFARVFELCSTVEENHRNTCYQSLGRDVSGRSLSNVEQTKHNCGLGKNLDQRTNCIIGAVKDFISYLHDDARAKQLCSVLDEQSIKDTCDQTTVSYYSTF